MESKQKLTGRVLSNTEIAAGVFQLDIESLEVALTAKPGQFINVYPKNPSTLLPRPISICWTDGATVTLVYGVVGEGTQEFSRYGRGDEISISTPMGNGYDLSFFAKESDGGAEKGKTAILVGGGIGVPPLLELAYELTQRGVQVSAVVGFRDEPFLIKPLLKAGADLYVATDSGASGFHGNVVDLIRQENLTADYYFACGPKVMLKALTDHCLSISADVQVSMEERMGCGYGACVGCVCKVKEKSDDTDGIVNKKVCKDGPVFWGSEVVWDGK